MKTQHAPLTCAISSAVLLMMSACGGGSDSPADAGAAPAPANPNVTLTGAVMIDGAIRNAVVCMDLNANGACDAGEPISAKTGADGAYSLSYDTTKVTAAQVAASSLIARMVPGTAMDANTTVDAAEPGVGNTAKPYVLRQVPGKAGQINPLTTLVAAGIASGLTEADARPNAAAQLAITEAKIDNYQDDPAFNDAQVADNARTAAKVTADALENGAVLSVGNQNSAVAASVAQLRSLSYTDAGNYSVRQFNLLAKVAGAPGSQVQDQRLGKTASAATAKDALYTNAYLTPNGWLRCDDTTPLQNTLGVPSRSIFCGAEASLGYNVPTDISGQTMASVIASMQADAATNTINAGASTANLLAAVGGASFPSGSALRTHVNLTLNNSIFISNITNDARPGTETSLEQTIAARPASGVNLATAAGSLTLGVSTGPLKNLRVAFTGTTSSTAGTVQFYDCDLNAAQTVASNCVATTAGTYAISLVNGVRVMGFSGHPEATGSNQVNFYAEVRNTPSVVAGERVFRVRQAKPAVDGNVASSKRLNGVAGSALRGQLGV
jgi:hypothetical protein